MATARAGRLVDLVPLLSFREQLKVVYLYTDFLNPPNHEVVIDLSGKCKTVSILNLAGWYGIKY